MLYLLFFQRRPAAEPYLEFLRGGYNLIPFRTIRAQLASIGQDGSTARFALRNLGGNVLLFVPLGIFLPCLFRRQRRFRTFLATVCGTITLVEGLQLLTTLGYLDIDDLILNVLGACAGWCIVQAAHAQISP